MTRKKKFTLCICIIIGFILVSAIIFFGIDLFVTKNYIYSYLNENYSRLEIDGDSVQGNVIENGYSVFFAGETHGSEKNYLAQLSLIKMLNKEEGVTQILTEMPHSVCVLLNNYLTDGDESILDTVFESIPEHNYFQNADSRNFFVQLKAFNDNLASDKKLRLSGLDIEFSGNSIRNAVAILQSMVAGVSNVPQPLEQSWSALTEIEIDANYSNESLMTVFNGLLHDISSEKGALSSALKSNLTDYVCIVQSVAETVKHNMSAYSDSQRAELRESLMYKIFQTVYSANARAKFFGQFGVEHIHLARRNYTNVSNSLAKQINDSETFNGKVCSIRFSYKNSQALDFYKNKTVNISQTMYESEFNNFPKANSSLTLFKIDGKGSIFKRQQIIVNGHGKCTADYFQYLLLIDESAACQKTASV